jgi:hypothetical protein
VSSPRITALVPTKSGKVTVSSDRELTIGGQVGADVVLKDPVLAPRHCAVQHDNGTFLLRDLGSVAGTWLDGQRVTAPTALRDGARIVLGTAVATVAIADGHAKLDFERGAFFWDKSEKGAFANDPDALVRHEVGFGRFPLLRVGNRLALVAGGALAIGATFAASVMEPLADAGPLLPAHALVQAAAMGKVEVPAHLTAAVAIAKEQSCDSCHTSGHGVTSSDCLACHGDLAKAPTWRHPYLGDGAMGPLPGIDSGEQFCVVCHIDHQGKDWLKPASAQLVGNCESCHAAPGAAFDRAALAARIPQPEVAMREQAIAAYRFPHEPHLAKQIPCALCHQIDSAVRAAAMAGLPSDPAKQDYAEIAYETCASCHVAGAAAIGITAEQQRQFVAMERQWPVAWHGTDNDGKHCLACHSATERDGRQVFGPEFRMVERGTWTPAEYVAERARYTTPTRSHQEQFAAHAQGRECIVCHVRGDVAIANPAPQRPFWHGLHLAAGAMQAEGAARAAISSDARAGCISCHTDLGDAANASGLTPAANGTYHWPTTSAAAAACTTCHYDGDAKQAPLAVERALPTERRSKVVDFPHGPHVGSRSFGVAGGKLADGCFSCHEFTATETGKPHELVPRTLATASDCRSCHTGHDHVGGGSCQQCHPNEPQRSNSFLVSSLVAAGSTLAGRLEPSPPPPSRSWPRNDSFSHLSPGHRDEQDCAKCHDAANLKSATTIAAIAIPDDRSPACRDCHLKAQFHWR